MHKRKLVIKLLQSSKNNISWLWLGYLRFLFFMSHFHLGTHILNNIGIFKNWSFYLNLNTWEQGGQGEERQQGGAVDTGLTVLHQDCVFCLCTFPRVAFHGRKTQKCLRYAPWRQVLCPIKSLHFPHTLHKLLGLDGKESACNAGERVRSLGQEDPLEKGMATHSSVLAWRIPRTE